MDLKQDTDNAGKGKARIPDVGQILKAIDRRGLFAGMQRYRYAYKAEDALPVIEAIGRARNPSFTIDGDNRFAYLNFIRWVHGDDTMQAISPTTGETIPGRLKRGIFIGGNTGTGKSWCIEIMRAYCSAMRFAIRLPDDDSPTNLWWQIFRSDEICDEYAAKGTLQRFKRMPIIAIQDLGAEPQETMFMGNRMPVMRQFLESRGDMTAELTLISSNFKMGGERMAAQYGDRVASRLCEMCNYLEIKGKDRRKR